MYQVAYKLTRYQKAHVTIHATHSIATQKLVVRNDVTWCGTHLVRVGAESAAVVLDPLHGQVLVHQPEVASDWLLRLGVLDIERHEAQWTQTIVQRHKHHVSRRHQFRSGRHTCNRHRHTHSHTYRTGKVICIAS